MSILVIGSLNMDFVTYTKRSPFPGETILGHNFKTIPGGKGANQAVASKRASSDVAMIGVVGKDDLGKSLKQVMKEEKIADYIKQKDVHTGIATIIIEESSQNRIIVVPGANHKIDMNDIDEELVMNAKIVLMQLETPLDIVLKCAKLAKKHQKIFILNPAPAQDLPEEIYQYIDYITPNETEVELLTKTKDFKDGANILLNKGVKNVIVTLGKDGVYFKNNHEEFKIDAKVVNAIDTTAAGDCFNGYFASGIDQGLSVKEAINIANIASSISVTRCGAIPSIPKIDEIKK